MRRRNNARMRVCEYLREHLINISRASALERILRRVASSLSLSLSLSLSYFAVGGFRTLFPSRPIRLPSDAALRGDRMIERADRIGARVPGSRSGHSIAR